MNNSLLKKNFDHINKDLNKVLQSIIDENGINADNIIFIATNLMTVVSKYEDISGRERKQIVLNVLDTVIDNIDTDNNNIKDLLKVMNKSIISSSIDLIIDVAKGRYVFDNIKKHTKKCHNKCLPFN